MDSELGIVFGYMCTEVGSPPKARRCCFRLLERRRILAFRYLLRFGQPGSKLYAVESLYLLKAWGYDISDEDAQLMEQVLKSEDRTTVCDGCMVYTEPLYRALTKKDLERVEENWQSWKKMGWVRK